MRDIKPVKRDGVKIEVKKGRPIKVKADVQAIKKLNKFNNDVIDIRAVVAYTMSKADCTYAEIGRVFNISRQQAQAIVSELEKRL